MARCEENFLEGWSDTPLGQPFVINPTSTTGESKPPREQAIDAYSSKRKCSSRRAASESSEVVTDSNCRT